MAKKGFPRPRIQATVSQKAYDIIISEMETPGSLLYNRSFSRAVDSIILDWNVLQKRIEKYQNQAAKYYQEIQHLKTESLKLEPLTLSFQEKVKK